MANSVRVTLDYLYIIFSHHNARHLVKSYQKTGLTKARPATAGEKVVTLVDGIKETTNKAKAGDWVVTGPKDEQYIIDGTTFASRYKKTNSLGVFTATGTCFAFEYKGRSLVFKAPWGEDMLVHKGDFIASTDASGRQCYRIEREIFLQTYQEIKNANRK